MVRRVVPFLLLTSLICSAQNSSFIDPPVFTSSDHVLDVLIIARPAQITLGSQRLTAWVYEICKSSSARQDQCPADSQTVSPYGGVRFQLTQGDHLRMRLVNHLPPAPADAQYAHGSDAMMNEMLAANPTNIHTHGLIVEPRKADASNPTYGDYVYVYAYPTGKMPAMLDPDLTATDIYLRMASRCFTQPLRRKERRAVVGGPFGPKLARNEGKHFRCTVAAFWESWADPFPADGRKYELSRTN